MYTSADISVTLRSFGFVIRNHFCLGMFIWHRRMLAGEFYVARYKNFFLKELGWCFGYRRARVLRVCLDVGWKVVMKQQYLLFRFQNVS
jgi:hypothetical protein